MTELTADFARALPGGGMDDSTYEAIESALDSVGAPLTDKPLSAGGRFLTLAERVFALEAERVTALSASPASPSERPALPWDTDKTERVRDREVIARIISPGCSDEENIAKYGGWARMNSAFRKADAILSALAVGRISSVAESGGSPPAAAKSDSDGGH